MLSESQNNTENHQFEPEETHMDVLEPVTTHYIDIDISPTLNVTSTGRPRRNYRLPRRFDDFLPEPSSPDETDDRIGFVRRVNLIVRDSFTTAANTFGIWREYPRRPTRDPDKSLSLSDLAQNPPKTVSPSTNPELHHPPNQPYWPFTNPTIHRFMRWLNNGVTTKSEAQVNELVHDVMLAPDFSQHHLAGFDAHRENMRLDSSLAKHSFLQQFTESSVDILVPSGDIRTSPKIFSVPGLLHRKLTAVLIDAFNSSLAHLFHFSPFKLYHKSPINKEDERIYGEIYTSDAFLQEHEKVQRIRVLPPNDPECKREKIMAALMFSSDATHLTSFGSAKAWPIYLMLGNLSKYIRARPDSGAMYHLLLISHR